MSSFSTEMPSPVLRGRGKRYIRVAVHAVAFRRAENLLVLYIYHHFCLAFGRMPEILRSLTQTPLVIANFFSYLRMHYALQPVVDLIDMGALNLIVTHRMQQSELH
jgi:hypothetical protein